MAVRTGFILALVGALGLGMAPSRAAGQAPEARLEEIREMVLYARYPEAIAAAEQLLGRGDLSARERNVALEVLATAQIANRQERAATDTLARLYARDPGHRLSDPDASPLVQSAFARARDTARAPVEVALALEAPGALPTRESPLITVRLEAGSDAIDEVRLGYRYEGDGRYATSVMMMESGVATARLPLAPGRDDAYAIEYYVEAVAPSRAPLAALGSQAEPLSLTVPARGADPILGGGGGGPGGGPAPAGDGGSVLGQWWLWAAIGVVLVGGVAAYVLLGPPSEGPPDGSLGNVTLGLW